MILRRHHVRVRLVSGCQVARRRVVSGCQVTRKVVIGCQNGGVTLVSGREQPNGSGSTAGSKRCQGVSSAAAGCQQGGLAGGRPQVACPAATTCAAAPGLPDDAPSDPRPSPASDALRQRRRSVDAISVASRSSPSVAPPSTCWWRALLTMKTPRLPLRRGTRSARRGADVGNTRVRGWRGWGSRCTQNNR